MAQQSPVTDPSSSLAKREPAYRKKYREFWLDEQAAAWLYRELAEIADDEGADTLRTLAVAEDRHAAHWAEMLKRHGVTDLEFKKAPIRQRVIARMGRRFGLESVLPMLIKLEAADAGKYLNVKEAPSSMSEEEVRHGRTLATIGKNAPSRIASIESRHRVGHGGALRAATFGINDGLVSNLLLVFGVAGGTTANSTVVLLAGVAGLFAGAFSMAAGEYVSVRSQRELYEREIEIEREELVAFPEEERDELALIYRAKGMDPDAAMALAERIMARPEVALDTLAREELGLDPNDLSSPWVAAGSSFVAFAIGAFIPVLPFLFMTGGGALTLAAVLSGVMLSMVGFSISLFTGRSGFFSAFRMLAIGAVAGAITYAVGSAVGASLG